MLCKLNEHGLSKNSSWVVNKSVLANLQTRKIFESFLFFQLWCFFTSLGSVTSNGMIFPPFHVGEKKSFVRERAAGICHHHFPKTLAHRAFSVSAGSDFTDRAFFSGHSARRGKKLVFLVDSFLKKLLRKICCFQLWSTLKSGFRVWCYNICSEDAFLRGT